MASDVNDNAATEMFRRVYEIAPDLAHELSTRGGVRGLFDVASSEWNSRDADEKLSLLRQLEAIGITVKDAARAAEAIMVRYGYSRHESHVSVCEGALELLGEALLEGMA